MRWLLALVFASTCLAATGDITAVRIAGSSTPRLDGWAAEIDIEGLGTGGTYTFGMGTYNVPSASTPYFTVTSAGYDDEGNTTTIVRRVYVTNTVRQVYPNEALNAETDNTTYVTIRVALDDYIYSTDTLTFTAPAAFYSQGGNNSVAASAMAVTNNSTEAHAKVIGHWTWPGYSRVTGTSFKLRAVAYHRSARQKRPVRAVKFTCTDESTNSASRIVLVPSIDTDMSADALPIVEYVAEMPTAPFDQGEVLTCNFIAYPWYGDSGAILNTGDGVNSQPTPLYAPQYYLNDKAGTYGQTVAVVNATTGNNSTCVAVDAAAFNGVDDAATSAPCLNIFAAANAIAAYNNTNYSRNNTAAGTIYLHEGSHTWTGGTVSAGGQANGPVWVTVTRFPTAARANVLINSSATGTKQVGEKLKMEDITITNTTTNAFINMDHVWIHNIDYNAAGTATISSNASLYMTHSRLWNDDEYRPYSTTNSPRNLIRGCTWQNDQTSIVRVYTFIGNRLVLATGFNEDATGQTVPSFENTITAYNHIAFKTSGGLQYGIVAINKTFGRAFVQNVFENVTSGNLTPVVGIASSVGSPEIYNNVLYWHNVSLGQRANLAYNDVNPGPYWHKQWSMKNNIFDDYNCVTDFDVHGGSPSADGYGNHAIIHGVGQSGNVILNRTGTAGYENKFGGLYYRVGSSLNPQFVSDQSWLGGAAGFGDYRLTASSPGLSFVPNGEPLLPFDLAGRPRAGNGSGSTGTHDYGTEMKRRVVRW